MSITTSSYNKHVQTQSTAIVKPVLEELLNNKVVVESLAAQIVDKWKGTISVVLRKKLIAILVHKIEESATILFMRLQMLLVRFVQR